MKIKITMEDLKKGRFDNISAQSDGGEKLQSLTDCTLTSEQTQAIAQFLFDELKRSN